jgi:tetratricopeptide (TPR) repeat protein
MIIPGLAGQGSASAPDPTSAAVPKAGNPANATPRADLPKPRQSAGDAFNAGLAALDEKRFADAVVLFKKAIEADSKQAIIWENLAAASVKLAASQSGPEAAASLQQGLDGYAKAVEFKPDEAVFHNNYALALARSGKFSEMRAEIKKCAELDPANAYHVYYNLGAVLANVEQMDLAADEFKLAIAAAPEEPANAESYFQLATTLMSKAQAGSDGKLIPAPGTVEALRKYLALAPGGPDSQAAKELLGALGSSAENGKAGKKK